MIVLLSPAKTIAPATAQASYSFYHPRLHEHSNKLAEILRGYAPEDLSDLMSISDKLAKLNYGRYQHFSEQPIDGQTPALLAFRGDVYRALGAEDFSERELSFADRHLRILSGLYGLLRPLDLMQPYRLEMGTRLPTERGDNLYQFWGDRITELLNQDLADDPSATVLNLASQEYFRAVNTAKLAGRLLHIHFREERGGKLRTVAIHAKRARGEMARLVVLEGITRPEPLQDLVANGYVYDADLSSGDNWTYTR